MLGRAKYLDTFSVNILPHVELTIPPGVEVPVVMSLNACGCEYKNGLRNPMAGNPW